MDEDFFKKVGTAVILTALVVLAYFLLKPILLSIIVGILFAFVLTPPYKQLLKLVKSKNLAASIICLLLALAIFLPFWYLTPIFIDQSVKIYFATQQIDFVQPLKTFFPSFFTSEQFSNEIGSAIHSFVTEISNSVVTSLSSLLLNFPNLALQFTVSLFSFFYVLRDSEKMSNYIKSLLPFSKEIEKKLFAQTKGITVAVIYGQIIIGIIQGLILSVGLLIFGIPNAIFLSLIATVLGVLPIIGTALLWIPILIYMVIAGDNFAAMGILIFGLLSSTVDNFLRPLFVSQRTSIHTSVILIGMIGGVFVFGVLGLLLGPLVLAYLLTILDIYRNKKVPAVFVNEMPKKE